MISAQSGKNANKFHLRRCYTLLTTNFAINYYYAVYRCGFKTLLCN